MFYKIQCYYLCIFNVLEFLDCVEMFTFINVYLFIYLTSCLQTVYKLSFVDAIL